nr:hypothetical protein [Nocardioides sp. IC4_145]
MSSQNASPIRSGDGRRSTTSGASSSAFLLAWCFGGGEREQRLLEHLAVQGGDGELAPVAALPVRAHREPGGGACFALFAFQGSGVAFFADLGCDDGEHVLSQDRQRLGVEVECLVQEVLLGALGDGRVGQVVREPVDALGDHLRVVDADRALGERSRGGCVAVEGLRQPHPALGCGSVLPGLVAPPGRRVGRAGLVPDRSAVGFCCELELEGLDLRPQTGDLQERLGDLGVRHLPQLLTAGGGGLLPGLRDRAAHRVRAVSGVLGHGSTQAATTDSAAVVSPGQTSIRTLI